MSLQDEIKNFSSQTKANLPAETINLMAKATNELAESGIDKQALATGGQLPAFSLPNVHGQQVSSETLLTQGPLVINFYRGSW